MKLEELKKVLFTILKKKVILLLAWLCSLPDFLNCHFLIA